MDLIDRLPTTNLGYHGGQPQQFELGSNSTLHNLSSKDGTPAFITYSRPYLKTLSPSILDRTGPIVRYLDLPHY